MEKKLTSCEGAFGAVLEQEGHLGPRTLVLKKVCWLPRSMNDSRCDILVVGAALRRGPVGPPPNE